MNDLSEGLLSFSTYPKGSHQDVLLRTLYQFMSRARMTVVRVRSHPGLFIQDCLQALPLVPWALSSSSCVLRFPLPLVLKVSQYILYQSVVLFLLIITMNYYSQSTVCIKVYSWCCTTMHVYVIHSTFWYPGLLKTLFIWCLWSRL